MNCYITHINRAREGLVEFQFALGTPDLVLEMVLPIAAFESFCRDRRINPAEGGKGRQPENPPRDFSGGI
ncbi:MAG: phenol hydroxylase subunit [Gammaproteobacteria bacterium]